MIDYRGDGWWLYVIEAKNGLVKIGVSTLPERRARNITANSPLPARVIAKWKAKYADEYALHKRFEAYRSHFEWFRCEGALAEFVAAMRGEGLPDGIIDWPDFSPATLEENRKESLRKRSASMKAAWAAPGVRERWSKQLRTGRRLAAEVRQ